MEKLVLVDGSGYIFRAFYALPFMKRSDGTPVNAVFGFCNMLLKLLEDIQKDSGGNVGVAIIFDASRETFRNKIYKNYKANRSEAPEDLIPQFEIIKKLPIAFNLPSIESLGYEADDLIASYSKSAINQGIKVKVVSSDKDLMQLLKKDLTLFDPMKKKEIFKDDVIEKFGVGPEKVIDVQSLAGDSSDNVPGVPGIGIKTAALLINEYGSLENLLNNLDSIKQAKRRESLEDNKHLAIISKSLVTLKEDVKLPIPMEKLSFKPLNLTLLYKFLDEMEFSRIKEQVISKYGNSLENETLNKIKIKSNFEKTEILRENYKLIQDSATLDKWLVDIHKDGVIAIDCETNSLSANEADIVGFSMSKANSMACYIPLAHRNKFGNEIKQISKNEFIKKIKPLMEDESILKIGQNIKYDLIVLSKLGILVENIDDTMLMSYVLNSGKNRHGLDELSLLYFGHNNIKFKDLTKLNKENKTFDYVDLDLALNYAAEDSDLTYRLWQNLYFELIKEKLYKFYYYFERPLIKILMNMEIYGINVDTNTLKKLSNDFDKKIKIVEDEIYEICNSKFNIGSPKQLGDVIFEKMKLPFGKKGKSGNYQTDVSVLEKLKTEKYEIAQKILSWRQFNKLKSTYCDGLIQRQNLKTKKIHTSYGMASTSTGRLSSNDPNLQNIPIKNSDGREIRKAFIAENKNFLVSIDYSQIELRILAHVAEINNLKEAFEKNYDIHKITAMEVFQKNEDEVSDDLRRKAKTINFGIIYGISAYGLASQLDISNSEAKDYINKYFLQYPGIKDYMRKTIEFCRNYGFVITPFGRRIYVPLINDSVPVRRNFGERSAINAPIQGGAADMIKRAMIKIFKYLSDERLKTKMLLQVHDELIFDIPESEISSVPKKIAKIMETSYKPFLDFSIPLKADIGIGKNWSEIH